MSYKNISKCQTTISYQTETKNVIPKTNRKYHTKNIQKISLQNKQKMSYQKHTETVIAKSLENVITKSTENVIAKSTENVIPKQKHTENVIPKTWRKCHFKNIEKMLYQSHRICNRICHTKI